MAIGWVVGQLRWSGGKEADQRQGVKRGRQGRENGLSCMRDACDDELEQILVIPKFSRGNRGIE